MSKDQIEANLDDAAQNLTIMYRRFREAVQTGIHGMIDAAAYDLVDACAEYSAALAQVA